MAEFRLGIIGCGGMGQSHQQGLKEIEDKVKVTCTCDIVEERAKAAAENLGAEHYVTDYKDMLDYVDGVLLVDPQKMMNDGYGDIGCMIAFPIAKRFIPANKSCRGKPAKHHRFLHE